MKAQGLVCSGCHGALPESPAELEALESCPRCAARMRTAVFPAYARLQVVPAEGVPLLLTGESPCFFHPARRAAVACDRCGRLVCSLCDLEVGADHWCPECLPLLDQEGRAGLLERERTRYDRVVGSMLLLGLVLGCGARSGGANDRPRHGGALFR